MRSGFCTPAQAASPTRIWHQSGVYPLLWSVAGSAGLAGLPAPVGPGRDAAGAWAPRDRKR